MRARALGNPTNKAWLAGWDAGICGMGTGVNPYSRKPQHDAWEDGRAAGRRSATGDARLMLRRARIAGQISELTMIGALAAIAARS